MSDTESVVEKPFYIEIAKQGRAACKKCKAKCLKKELRIAKLQGNPFGDGKMKAWHHIDCLFEVFAKQRPTTKRIENPNEDIDGWESLSDEEKQDLIDKINACNEKFGGKPISLKQIKDTKNSDVAEPSVAKNRKVEINKDDYFREFRRLVADIANTSSYTEKTETVKKLFDEGSEGDGFKGDIYLWCRLLLPGFVKRVYNLQSKQLVKLFSKLLNADVDEMMEHLESGDVGETIQKFFEESNVLKPNKKSTLTLKEVNEFLENLSKLTKEDDQMDLFKTIVPKCTPNDLKTIIHLIKHDLRMNAGAKHILNAVHPDAYASFQNSRDLNAVIKRCKSNDDAPKITIMTPVLPMLAEACKSVEQAMKKCPNGMFSEIKYDGERVQVHKQDGEFKYFSRNLKPVLAHKVAHLKNYIPKAFPKGDNLILDCEILMIDKEGKPLPFGTLGIHKKSEFKEANVCLFVFDCIYYNNEILVDKPIKERKAILDNVMTEIPQRVVFSEMKEIHNSDDLKAMIAKVLKLGLEGLVLKDLNSIYEPGKRHWLKVKKDYLFGGAMADSADLIALGAWYGTGRKGGLMSIFLMGVYDETRDRFCTVTKVHQGLDDKTLDSLQSLKMIKISGDADKVPSWLKCNKTMIPDFVAEDPKEQPVWEISGAEFTQHEVHTADGISIRFPRITKFRDDKNWKTATTLLELKELYRKSKEETDVSLLMQGVKQEDVGQKRKTSMKNGVPEKKQKIQEEEEEEENEPTTSTGKRHSGSSPTKKVVEKPKLEGENDEDSSSMDNRIKLKNPIPDYFPNVRVIAEKEIIDKYPQWIRYFLAYGGTIVKPEDEREATHYVHIEKTTKEIIRIPGNKIIRHVTLDWIKDTIANKGPVPDLRPYYVIWKPS